MPMSIATMYSSRRFALLTASLVALVGCKGTPDSQQQANTPPPPSASAADTTGPTILRGTVVSATASEVVLKTDSGDKTIKLGQPFHLFARSASDMSQVKETSFIGVTTVKQPDGSERATEIHVFPEELRGLGQGSRMMAPDTSASATASRMTNGNVAASVSRMSNGNVSRTNGSSLVVEYPGGSQNVTVPPNTPVTELKLTTATLTSGAQTAVLVKKGGDGSLSSNAAILTSK
jgi:hypothetical protein